MIRKKTLVLFTVLVAFLISGLCFNQVINPSEQIKQNINPRSSQLTELLDVIRIDNNWTETAAMYDWCTGSGTEEDPYVIQGINISSGERGACISIEDSVEYFVIKNCSLNDVVRLYGHWIFAGVYIYKAEFGLIENCTFTNSYFGVSIIDAEEVKITDCRFIGSHNDSLTGMGSAVHIERGENLDIAYNYIKNYYFGVHAAISEGCIVDHNHIENMMFGYTADSGVYFDAVNNSAITNNDFYGCEATTQYSNGLKIGLKTAGFGSSAITVNPNCININVFGNRYFDENGDLITDSLIPSFDIPIILGTIASIAIIGIMRRKKKIG